MCNIIQFTTNFIFMQSGFTFLDFILLKIKAFEEKSPNKCFFFISEKKMYAKLFSFCSITKVETEKKFTISAIIFFVSINFFLLHPFSVMKVLNENYDVYFFKSRSIYKQFSMLTAGIMKKKINLLFVQ